MTGRTLYHYTALHHADEIKATGAISRGGVPIPSADGAYLEAIAPGWQWVTDDPTWGQPWATRKLTRCDRTECRLVVDIPLLELDRLVRWDAVAGDFGYTPELAQAFADLAGGDSSRWWLFRGRMPYVWVRTVETRPGLVRRPGKAVVRCAR